MWRIDEVDSLKLIREVQKYPCIYDLDHENYPDWELKKRVWISIIKALLGEKWEKLSENEQSDTCRDVRAKWKNIKDSYYKSLKMKEGLLTPVVSRPKKPYLYQNHLTFLKPFVRTRRSINNRIKKSPETYDNTEFSKSPHRKGIAINLECSTSELTRSMKGTTDANEIVNRNGTTNMNESVNRNGTTISNEINMNEIVNRNEIINVNEINMNEIVNWNGTMNINEIGNINETVNVNGTIISNETNVNEIVNKNEIINVNEFKMNEIVNKNEIINMNEIVNRNGTMNINGTGNISETVNRNGTRNMQETLKSEETNNNREFLKSNTHISKLKTTLLSCSDKRKLEDTSQKEIATKRCRLFSEESQTNNEYQLTLPKNDTSRDPDAMFLLSQLPVIKRIRPDDKLEFQIQFMQLLQSFTKRT